VFCRSVDTPGNLTARLRGSETLLVQVDGEPAQVTAALQQVAGVTRVQASDAHGQHPSYEVDSERGRDVRRDLARAVVGGGFGLLELRPVRMSLEEIFLSLTTEEQPEQEAAHA
jgi:ABC-2 type transport system ATP-binding protein